MNNLIGADAPLDLSASAGGLESFALQQGEGNVIDVFTYLRNRKNPYRGEKADAARDDARARLPIKYARTAAAEIGNHAPNHNVLTLAHALAYAERGLHVIDSHALDFKGKGTGPGGQSKVPRGAKWQERASNDPDEVLAFWTGDGSYSADKKGEEYPYAPVNATRNVSIAFPEGCGLFVLDIDGEAGRKALEVLESEHGDLPQTWESITGSGGLHLIFRAEDCPSSEFFGLLGPLCNGGSGSISV